MIRLMMNTPLILTALAAAATLAALWLFITWYTADEQPMFGPAKNGRVTFKQVLQNAFRDVADLAAPAVHRARALWEYVGSMVGVAVLSLDAYIVQTPELKLAVMATPYGLAALLLLNLAAAFARMPPRPTVAG